MEYFWKITVLLKYFNKKSGQGWEINPLSTPSTYYCSCLVMLNILKIFSQSHGLALLSNLYVSRCYHVWKYPEILPFLEKNVNRVVERVEAKDPEVVKCEEKRKSRYQGTPLNIYRHVIVSDIADVRSSLPEVQIHFKTYLFLLIQEADHSLSRQWSSLFSHDCIVYTSVLPYVRPHFSLLQVIRSYVLPKTTISSENYCRPEL